MSAPRLFLFDTYGFIFRAYHARARSSAPPMRTASGLPTEAVFIFGNLLRKVINTYQPDYLAAVFESGVQTLREQEYADYKANRAEAPDDLKLQIPYVRRFLEAMRIPCVNFAGYEADDVIGTMACRGQEAGLDVVIVSSDKDLMQLVNERISMFNPVKEDTWYDPAKVEEFMGVPPRLVPDLLALKGDAIDNIPGAPGIGDKGARDLIQQFGPVEEVLARAEEVQRKTYRESLQANREQVLLSKRLATVECSVPVEFSLEQLTAHGPDNEALRQLYKELEFYSLLKELGPTTAAPGSDYAPLANEQEVSAYLASIPPDAPLALAVQTTGKGDLALTTLGLCWQVGRARSLGVQHLSLLRELLEDEGREKVTHDLKALLHFLSGHGMCARGVRHDVMLYAFLLSSDASAASLETLSERHMDLKLTAGVEQSAEVTLELMARLLPDVQARQMEHLYRDIDRPLVPVLYGMERLGIRIEPAQLQRMAGQMDGEIQRLAKEVYALAGRSFNIGSPQQLGKVLFEEMALPSPNRYGKGKQVSTAADVLEGLAEEHPIAQLVLDYRQLTKLKGTYVDTLPELMDANQRVHTTFNMTVATTGRLSSTNPNLQNIPIRTPLGREIRAAFVPEPGWRLIAADYSQIELRLFAHLSGDPTLVEAFQTGQDIHARTASDIFSVPLSEVTSDQRRFAKTVNFATMYGQSTFGLAKQLGIDRAEAERRMKAYFETYAGVRRYIDGQIEEVRQTGMVQTLFGRQRHVPDMTSRNVNARTFAERTAVNSPIQGTAADLIKLAMIRIDAKLTEEKRQTRMLLQVHDELLFEAPPEEAEEVAKMVCREMETVHSLSVPLVVDVGIGDNWRDAK